MSQPKLLKIQPATSDFLRSYLKDFIEGHTTIGGTSCSICGGSKSRHRIEDCFVGLAQSFLSDLED